MHEPSDDDRDALGPKAVERLLCSTEGRRLEDIAARPDVPWNLTFPDVTSLDALSQTITNDSGETAASGSLQGPRVCIACEDIAGPIRNGGIGSTYTALARLLAKNGLDVTVLYLHGHHLDSGLLHRWIETFADDGIAFLPVPDYAGRDGLLAPGQPWLTQSYNTMRFLIETPMDVVHVSEWRGTGYLSLLAKMQKLAFNDTTFIVKTSSPWLWNRLYGHQPLKTPGEIVQMAAERRSVEMADMVIGGSSHLLNWMATQGYRLPARRTFVQPNVVTLDKIADLIGSRMTTTKMPVDEIVFFGRLEARKGLVEFCAGIDRLLRDGVKVPAVTFMGKPGVPLPGRSGEPVLKSLERMTRDWPMAVKVLTDKQQTQALSYLLGGHRLAVMPALIENSSIAVYEALSCGIPFLASDSGGTKELISEEDQDRALCVPHPIPLAQKLRELIDHGVRPCRPAFDNDDNLDVWVRFHRAFGFGAAGEIKQRRQGTDSADPSNGRGAGNPADRVSLLVSGQGDEDLVAQTLVSLSTPDRALIGEVLVGSETTGLSGLNEQVRDLKIAGIDVRVVDTRDCGPGHARNRLAGRAAGQRLLFCDAGTRFAPGAIAALCSALSGAGAAFVVGSARGRHGAVSFLLPEHLGAMYAAPALEPLPVLAEKNAFDAVRGFACDTFGTGQVGELAARATADQRMCLSTPFVVADISACPMTHDTVDKDRSWFQAVRPHLAAAPLPLREILLLAPPPAHHHSPRGAQSRARFTDILKRVAQPFRNAETGPAGAAPAHAARVGLRDLSRVLGTSGPKSGAIDLAPPAEDVALAESQSKRGDARSVALARQRHRAHRLRAVSGEQDASKLITGGLLTVYRGQALGWAINEHAPSSPIELEAYAADRLIGRGKTGAQSPLSLEYLRHDIHNHVFTIDLSDAGSGPVTIRVAGGDEQVGTVLSTARPRQPNESGPDGFCERIDDGHLLGWIFDAAEPARRHEVAIIIGDKLVALTRAYEVRGDLFDAGLGDGGYGFNVPLPSEFLEGGSHRITVVAAATGRPLKNGTGTIVQARLKRGYLRS